MPVKIFVFAFSILISMTLLPARATGSGDDFLKDPEDAPSFSETDPALRAEAQRRLRTYRAVALAQYLDLEEEKALAMNAIISEYDDKRRALQMQLHEYMQTLRAASLETDPDPELVSAAVEGVLNTRMEIEKLKHEEARKLLNGLDPARQAKLLLFFGEFPREIRRLMREGQRRRHRGPDAPLGKGYRGGHHQDSRKLHKGE